MKKISRILAIVLALVMVLSGSVFAAWVSFQNDDTNNGVITTSVPTGTSVSVTPLQLPHGGYVGIDVPPVIDSDGYAYILESAASTTRLVKVDLANNSIVTNNDWAGSGTGNEGVEVRGVSAFQLSTPVINGDYVYVASTDFAQKNTDESFQSLVSGPSEWEIDNDEDEPNFYVSNGIVHVSDALHPFNLDFTLSQTFTGVAGDNLRIECAALGYRLTTGSLKVYLNSNTTPLIDLDLSEEIGYAINQSVSNSALVNGTNTVTIRITGTGNNDGTQKSPYVQLHNFKLYEENGAVVRVRRSDGDKTTIVNGIPGQLNTPLTYKSGKLYFGSYYAGGGKYYQADISGTTFPVTPVEFNSGKSHYWSGAYVNENYAYFGSYDGKLYWPSVTSFSTVSGHVKTVGTEVSISAGDICSSVCYKNNKIYFTSKNGYLWCYDISAGTPVFNWYVDLEAPSTSTPVVSSSGIIYVGTYSGFTTGSVYAVKAPTSGNIGTKYQLFNGKPVQSSVIVKFDNVNFCDYLYFTTNSSDGAGYCYQAVSTGSGVVGSPIWNTTTSTGLTYTLQGMAAGSNCVVFGNDGSKLYIVKAATSR